MEWLSIAFVVAGTLVCVVVPLAVSFVVFVSMELRERRAERSEVDCRPVLAPPAAERVALDLAVDVRDAARTERLLQKLIATSQLEDW
jgi:hypothetical protein